MPAEKVTSMHAKKVTSMNGGGQSSGVSCFKAGAIALQGAALTNGKFTTVGSNRVDVSSRPQMAQTTSFAS
eukprot:916050-Amphidinium_carterae.1